jgi:hypothetical protein
MLGTEDGSSSLIPIIPKLISGGKTSMDSFNSGFICGVLFTFLLYILESLVVLMVKNEVSTDENEGSEDEE